MIQLEDLTELGRTTNGLNRIYEAKHLLQQKISFAKASGNRKALTRRQKQFFHSPAVRYAALVSAARSHWPIKGDDTLLNLSESLTEAVKMMDWNAYPMARPIHWVIKLDGSERRISASAGYEDSAREILLKWMLEAEWQTGLDACSYSVKDVGVPKALAEVSDFLFRCPRFFLKLDIKDCYKNLESSFLEGQLQAVLTNFAFRKVQPFLQVAYKEDSYTWREENGIPQGGRLSALALEIVFKDLSAFVTDGFPAKQLFFARYVDDLLLLSSDTEILAVAEKRLSEWLARAGLSFNEAKRLEGTTAVETKISSGYLEPAFKFLGWQVAQYLEGESGAYQTVFRFVANEDTVAEKFRVDGLENYKSAIEGQRVKLQERVGVKAKVLLEINGGGCQLGFGGWLMKSTEPDWSSGFYVS